MPSCLPTGSAVRVGEITLLNTAPRVAGRQVAGMRVAEVRPKDRNGAEEPKPASQSSTQEPTKVDMTRKLEQITGRSKASVKKFISDLTQLHRDNEKRFEEQKQKTPEKAEEQKTPEKDNERETSAKEKKQKTPEEDNKPRTFKNGGEYFRGVNLEKLGKLAKLLPSTGLDRLAICLLNNSELVPEGLALLCKVFPNEDPQDLSDLTKEIVFDIGALKEAEKQGVRFQGAGIKRENVRARDVSSALKQFEGGNLKSLFELGKEYPDCNIIDAVRLKQHQRRESLMAKLNELFPGTSPHLKNTAWTLFSRNINADVDEFERLINNGTVSRGDGEGNAVFAMRQYLVYLDMADEAAFLKVLDRAARLRKLESGCNESRAFEWALPDVMTDDVVNMMERLRPWGAFQSLNQLFTYATLDGMTPEVFRRMERLRALGSFHLIIELFKFAKRDGMTDEVVRRMERLKKKLNLYTPPETLFEVATREGMSDEVVRRMERLKKKISPYTPLKTLFEVATREGMSDEVVRRMERLRNVQRYFIKPYCSLDYLFELANRKGVTNEVVDRIEGLNKVYPGSRIDRLVKVAMRSDLTTEVRGKMLWLNDLYPNSRIDHLADVATRSNLTREVRDMMVTLSRLKRPTTPHELYELVTSRELTPEVLTPELLNKMRKLDDWRHQDMSLDKLFERALEAGEKKTWRFSFGFNIVQSTLRRLSSFLSV